MDKSKILHSEFYKGYTLLVKGEYKSNVWDFRGYNFEKNDTVYLYYKRFVGDVDVNSKSFNNVPNVDWITIRKPTIKKSLFKNKSNPKPFEELVSEKLQLIIHEMRNKIDVEMRDQEITNGLLDSLKGLN